MKKLLILFLSFQISQTVLGQKNADLIIKDVNVISMTSDTVIKNKSIAILKGKIIDINDFAKLKKNTSTKIIDGTNKYVMPGLTEMHIHLPSSNKLDTFLTTIVAAGITHLRVMHSDENIAEQRKLITPIVIKPKIYFPYELTTKTTIKSEQQIDSLFKSIKKDKYDFIKFYSINWRKDFSDTLFDRIMKVANQNQMIVCGHYPGKVNLDKVIASGFKSIEHLGGYVGLPEDKIESAIQLTKKYNLYNCPTLDWDVMAYDLPFPDKYDQRLVFYNAPKHYITNWNKGLEEMIKRNGIEKITKGRDDYLPTFNKKMRILKRLNETGNLLILGGESENLFQLEGFNMYEEMANWSVAGISNYDILKASIVNPAKFFNEEKIRGSIEIGKDADLILLENNPLEDIKNIKTIYTTIIKGEVYHKSDLIKKI